MAVYYRRGSSFNAFLLMKGWRRVGFLSNDLDPESILLLLH